MQLHLVRTYMVQLNQLKWVTLIYVSTQQPPSIHTH